MCGQIDCFKGQFCELIVISIFRAQEESGSLSLMEVKSHRDEITDKNYQFCSYFLRNNS